jgi:hypothetical protein
MSNREVMQQALEFLMTRRLGAEVVIEALNTALAQPEQEPVGKVIEIGDNGFKCEFNQRLAVGTKLYIAPPLPVQKPVSCRFCHSKKGCWAWQCYKCGEIDDVQKPAPPAAQPEQRKPLDEWVIDRLANNIRTADPVTWWRQLARDVENAHNIKEKP